MPSNIQKKAAISTRKNASATISADGFSTVNRERTNDTNDTNDQTQDQSARTRGGSTFRSPTTDVASKMNAQFASMHPTNPLDSDQTNDPSPKESEPYIEEISQQKRDFYKEEYKIGYEAYVQSMKTFTEEQENRETIVKLF